MSLSEHVRTLGRGPGRSRSLTQDEAHDAMQLMLSESAAREAVGALLMLLRMKGETAEEVAGFASAATSSLPALPAVDLDWPSYAAGRTRGEPWFLASARLVAEAGYRVLLHGWNGQDQTVRNGLKAAGIAIARNTEDAARTIERNGIVYLPLETLSPALFRLLNLREVLGLRSCMNTVCRMLNPALAQASVQGVFHPSYRKLQADAAELLGWEGLSVIKGAGGEFECNPAKDIAVFGLRNGKTWETSLPAIRSETRRMSDKQGLSLLDVWNGSVAPEFETDLIRRTTALALETLGHAQPDHDADTLWANRNRQLAA